MTTMQATTKQKQLIHVNAPTRDTKEEFVQWATGDVEKTSCNDLNFDQANKILVKLGIRPLAQSLGRPLEKNWGRFDKSNKQHMRVMSQLHQIGWTQANERYGTVADIDRLGQWLQSERSPVRKPLRKMNGREISKIINALNSMTVKKYAK
jgi:hypothetical protein